MPTECELQKDAMIEALYGEKGMDPSLQGHLHQCPDCQEAFKGYEGLRSLYQALPDREPPPHLTDKIFSKIEQGAEPLPGFFAWVGRWLLHPASVAAMVFTLTLGGTVLYRRQFSSTQDPRVALSPVPEKRSEGPSELSPPPVVGSYLRMVDWNPSPRLIPDLDRPVLRVADVASLEQASIESVASFKHQVAMRHILDGEYDKAGRVLDGVIDNYMNYSHWDQAVVMHLSVMKKLGRQDEVRRDLKRLREYAMSNPEFVSQVERQYKD